MDDGPVSTATLLWTARRILAQHDEPPSDSRATGECAQCTEAGCGQVEWAMLTLSRLVPQAS
jgi:hypothetical protein